VAFNAHVWILRCIVTVDYSIERLCLIEAQQLGKFMLVAIKATTV